LIVSLADTRMLLALTCTDIHTYDDDEAVMMMTDRSAPLMMTAPTPPLILSCISLQNNYTSIYKHTD